VLQPAYTKISWKLITCAQVYLNHAVIHHFNWLADTIDASDGVHMLDAVEWDASDMDLIIYTDVSLTGLGFTAPHRLIGFCASMPANKLLATIFYYEALAIASAILWATGLRPSVNHLLIYTNSLNCIDMFNSLHAQEGYSDILLFTVCMIISTKISLRIFHIPGTDNAVANALSQQLLATTINLLPGLKIHHFQPPCEVLGPVK